MNYNISGQISIEEYIDSKRKRINGCEDCICRNCLYYWSSRCPYGGCYDDYRSKEKPYNVVHPNKPPRTAWSNWKKEQAFWCRGGVLYPVNNCENFIKYQGQKVMECLEAMVSVFQDGYIQCSLVNTIGCEQCYERFEERLKE